jgi:hypothetical protein
MEFHCLHPLEVFVAGQAARACSKLRLFALICAARGWSCPAPFVLTPGALVVGPAGKLLLAWIEFNPAGVALRPDVGHNPRAKFARAARAAAPGKNLHALLLCCAASAVSVEKNYAF